MNTRWNLAQSASATWSRPAGLRTVGPDALGVGRPGEIAKTMAAEAGWLLYFADVEVHVRLEPAVAQKGALS
jgi:hypothetical protein